MNIAGVAKNYLGLYDQAITWFRRAIEANRNYPHPHFVLGAALAMLGRLDEARSSVRAGLALNPTLTISRARPVWSAMSDDRPIWPNWSAFSTAYARPARQNDRPHAALSPFRLSAACAAARRAMGMRKGEQDT